MIPEYGVVTQPSAHSVAETVARIEGLVRAKGLTLFATIDHSGEAAKVGLRMPETKLVVFGSPKAGTPVMLAAPLAALDLPLKALVWEDHDGRVWVSYNDAAYLAERHSIPAALVANIAGIDALVGAAIALK
jgi:uncharacterized protein (DUF302 family)